MAYTHFRHIAYQFPTVAVKMVPFGTTTVKRAIFGVNPGKVTDPPELLGDTQSLDDDARTRIQRLIGVMIKAEEKISRIGDNDNTLKIFTVPEFYFRPDRKESLSYNYSEYKAIRNVLEETISDHGNFAHWLIIPGTIMWKTDDSSPKHAPTTAGDTVYFNSAVYMYFNSLWYAAYDSGKIEKIEASKLDGIPTGRHAGDFAVPGKLTPAQKAKRKSASEMFPKYLTYPQKDKHVFMAAGIQFGLDICMEHSFGVIPKNPTRAELQKIGRYRVTRNVVLRQNQKRVQVHLLIAEGMNIREESVAAIEGGYILRNDGGGSIPFTESRKITGYVDVRNNSKSDVTSFSSKASLGPQERIVYIISIGEGDPLYLGNPPGGVEADWKAHPQMVRIYETGQLP
jgi:hypothetical protein